MLLKAQYANPGGWAQILAYMAFCEVSQEQTPGSAAYAGDFGFKVLTASDPAEKTKKLNAEIANGRLAMMAIIGMCFPAGMGFCAHIVCYSSTRKETSQRVWLKECNNVEHQHNRINIVEERNTVLCQFVLRVLSFWSLFLASHVFSTLHVWLCNIVLTAIFTDMFASKVSCRVCREWIVPWCDMHRLYHRYNAFETCTNTCLLLQIWYYSFCLLTKLYIHILCDYISYRAIAIISFHLISGHIISYCIILCHVMSHLVFLITTISILPPCAFDLCHNFHVPGWSDRKRLGRLGQLHSISFARIREWTRRAGARGFLGSRRLYRRRKRGGLQATSRHRDQTWSHFDVGHHGIHHPSDLDFLKLRLKSFTLPKTNVGPKKIKGSMLAHPC